MRKLILTFALLLLFGASNSEAACWIAGMGEGNYIVWACEGWDWEIPADWSRCWSCSPNQGPGEIRYYQQPVHGDPWSDIFPIPGKPTPNPNDGTGADPNPSPGPDPGPQPSPSPEPDPPNTSPDPVPEPGPAPPGFVPAPPRSAYDQRTWRMQQNIIATASLGKGRERLWSAVQIGLGAFVTPLLPVAGIAKLGLLEGLWAERHSQYLLGSHLTRILERPITGELGNGIITVTKPAWWWKDTHIVTPLQAQEQWIHTVYILKGKQPDLTGAVGFGTNVDRNLYTGLTDHQVYMRMCSFPNDCVQTNMWTAWMDKRPGVPFPPIYSGYPPTEPQWQAMSLTQKAEYLKLIYSVFTNK